MMFFLGTHEPSWLGRTAVPLFVSARRLRRYRTHPRALGPWSLDSGGFTEVSTYGAWKTPAATYAREAEMWQASIGGLQWAAPQDWMCEPPVLQKTGLSVKVHQERSVDSVIELRTIAPKVPWIPVLQGWEVSDYLRHADAYAARGIDLQSEPVVGVGTVCRRQSTKEGAEIVEAVAGLGIAVHGFGFKRTGLAKVGHLLASADSLAWSLNARRSPPLDGCAHGAKGNGSCANCIRWALQWRDQTLSLLEKP